jgi:hypothetical protein
VPAASSRWQMSVTKFWKNERAELYLTAVEFTTH